MTKATTVGVILAVLCCVATSHAATYWETIASQNPSGYWRFNETGGTTAAPTVGSVSGTLINGVTTGVAGLQTAGFGSDNTALELENTGKSNLSQAQYVNFGDNFDSTRNAFSFSAWINPESWHNSGGTFAGTLLAKWGTGGGTGNQLFMSLNDNPVGTENMLAYVDATANKPSTPAGSIDLGQWHHVALVYQGDDPGILGNDGYAKLYINGDEAASLSLGLEAYKDGTSHVFLGAPNSGNYAFDGLIDEVAIWDGTALSGEEIRAQYLASVPEPSTAVGILTAGAAAAALVVWRRRRLAK